MGSIFAVVFMAFIMWLVVRGVKNISPEGSNKNAAAPKVINKTVTTNNVAKTNAALTNNYAMNAQRTTHNHNKNAHNINKEMSHEIKGAALKDDRYNDWLARQMREERMALSRLSDMFELKMEHRSSCEAEMIRRFREDAAQQ